MSIRRRALLSSGSPAAIGIEREWGLIVFDKDALKNMVSAAVVQARLAFAFKHSLLSGMTANPAAGVTGDAEPPPGNSGVGES